MKKTLPIKFLLAVLTFLIVIFATSFFALAEDKIVAIVNEEIITQKDLDEFMNFMFLQLSAKYKDEELRKRVEEMKPDLLNRLIDDKLILQKARKEKISIDEARVKSKLEEIRSRYLSDADFQSALAKQGLTQADIETKIREQLFIYSMIDSQIKNKIVITPKEVTDFYEQHQQDFVETQTLRVRSLMIRAEDLASKVWDALSAGKDFEAASKEYGVEINNLGLVKKGQLIKEIEDIIFGLEINGISKPVKSGDYYYIFKVEEIMPAKKYNLTEVQDLIHTQLYESKMRQKLIEWLAEFKKKSYVEIK